MPSTHNLLRRIACFLALLCCQPGFAFTADAPPVAHLLPGAERFLLQGRADDASAALKASLAAQPSNAAAHLLLCRVFLSEELADQAVTECQAALANGLANNSAAQDWTGRALGLRASHAGMLSGLKLALEVRDAFETAVALNPASEPACVDLGEYYTSAPGIVGGGNDKALALASRIEGTLPETAHRIRAMAAERDKDYSTAEREFQAEIAVAHRPGAIVDLAAFYHRRHDTAKAISTAQMTIAADPSEDAEVIEAASILDEVHQTAAAEQVMRSYLARGDQSDRAPAFRVRTMLGRMLAHAGDKTGARAEFEQALALASQYAPAQKGLGSL